MEHFSEEMKMWDVASRDWYNRELWETLMDPEDDATMVFVLSRMWLCQLMAEGEVTDYDDTVAWLRRELLNQHAA